MKRKHTKPASAKASANCGRFPECISPPAPCARMMPTDPRLTSGLVTTQESVLPFSNGICKSACICYTQQGPLAELPSTTSFCRHSQHSCRLRDLWNPKGVQQAGQSRNLEMGAQAFDKIPGKGASEIGRAPVGSSYARL